MRGFKWCCAWCKIYDADSVVTMVRRNKKVNDLAFIRRSSEFDSAFHWNNFGVLSPWLSDFLFYSTFYLKDFQSLFTFIRWFYFRLSSTWRTLESFTFTRWLILPPYEDLRDLFDSRYTRRYNLRVTFTNLRRVHTLIVCCDEGKLETSRKHNKMQKSLVSCHNFGSSHQPLRP